MMKVEGECKDQTQREGEERDIESAHARWWCVCVRMSDGAGEEMLAATQISGARGGQKRDTGAGRERARGSRQRGGARRAERAIARRPRTGGGAGGITHAHTWTCTELRGAGVGGGVYTDEKETRMKDAEGENAGEERDRAEGRQGGANVAKVAAE